MHKLALVSFHGCPVARLGEVATGGMNVYVLQLAREFARRGNHVDVYTRCHDTSDPKVVELEYGARVVHLQAGPHSEQRAALYEYIPEFLRNLRDFQRSEGIEYDILHSHYWLSGRIGMTLAEEWKVPHLVTFHTLAKTKLMARVGEYEPQLRIAVEKLVSNSADGVVVSTDQEKQDIVRLYQAPPQKVRVIPPGVDLQLFRPVDRIRARQALGFSMDDGVILYVGRIEPLKGLNILLEAISLLGDNSTTRLLVVGGTLGQDNELARLKSLSLRLGIEKKVVFAGTVRQAQLPEYYGAADVFVLPSYYESFGLAALEAMACGLPVVVSRVGGLKTFIEDGVTGYLIPWHCPTPFAQRLDVLLANPPLRHAMGVAARARAEKMNWSTVGDRMLAYYRSLMDVTWERVVGA